MTREHADLSEELEIPAIFDIPEDLEDLALGDDYALNPEYVELVIDAADRGDDDRLRELVGALRSEDVADLMGFLTADYREQVIPQLDPETLGEVLSELDTNLREEVMESVPSTTLARALEEMDSDDAVDLVEDLEDDKRAQVLAAMDHEERDAIVSALKYEDETAGRLMQRDLMAAPAFWTVGQTIDHIRGASDDLPELFFDVYVIDPAHKPTGAVPVSRLLRANRDQPLAEIMEPVTEIDVEMDQEEVAYIFDKYHLISAPVIDAGGRLVGQITVDDIVEVIKDEGEEDILALAGVGDAGRDATIWGITRSRLPLAADQHPDRRGGLQRHRTVPGGNRQAGHPGHPDADRLFPGRQRRHPDPDRRRSGSGQPRAERRQRHADHLAGAGRRPSQRGGAGGGHGPGDPRHLPRRHAVRDHRPRADHQSVHRGAVRDPGAARPGQDGTRSSGFILGFRHLPDGFHGFPVLPGAGGADSPVNSPK